MLRGKSGTEGRLNQLRFYSCQFHCYLFSSRCLGVPPPKCFFFIGATCYGRKMTNVVDAPLNPNKQTNKQRCYVLGRPGSIPVLAWFIVRKHASLIAQPLQRMCVVSRIFMRVLWWCCRCLKHEGTKVGILTLKIDCTVICVTCYPWSDSCQYWLTLIHFTTLAGNQYRTIQGMQWMWFHNHASLIHRLKGPFTGNMKVKNVSHSCLYNVKSLLCRYVIRLYLDCTYQLKTCSMNPDMWEIL